MGASVFGSIPIIPGSNWQVPVPSVNRFQVLFWRRRHQHVNALKHGRFEIKWWIRAADTSLSSVDGSPEGFWCAQVELNIDVCVPIEELKN